MNKDLEQVESVLLKNTPKNAFLNQKEAIRQYVLPYIPEDITEKEVLEQKTYLNWIKTEIPTLFTRLQQNPKALSMLIQIGQLKIVAQDESLLQIWGFTSPFAVEGFKEPKELQNRWKLAESGELFRLFKPFLRHGYPEWNQKVVLRAVGWQLERYPQVFVDYDGHYQQMESYFAQVQEKVKEIEKRGASSFMLAKDEPKPGVKMLANVIEQLYSPASFASLDDDEVFNRKYVPDALKKIKKLQASQLSPKNKGHKAYLSENIADYLGHMTIGSKSDGKYNKLLEYYLVDILSDEDEKIAVKQQVKLKGIEKALKEEKSSDRGYSYRSFRKKLDETTVFYQNCLLFAQDFVKPEYLKLYEKEAVAIVAAFLTKDEKVTNMLINENFFWDFTTHFEEFRFGENKIMKLANKVIKDEKKDEVLSVLLENKLDGQYQLGSFPELFEKVPEIAEKDDVRMHLFNAVNQYDTLVNQIQYKDESVNKKTIRQRKPARALATYALNSIKTTKNAEAYVVSSLNTAAATNFADIEGELFNTHLLSKAYSNILAESVVFASQKALKDHYAELLQANKRKFAVDFAQKMYKHAAKFESHLFTEHAQDINQLFEAITNGKTPSPAMMFSQVLDFLWKSPKYLRNSADCYDIRKFCTQMHTFSADLLKMYLALPKVEEKEAFFGKIERIFELQHEKSVFQLSKEPSLAFSKKEHLNSRIFTHILTQISPPSGTHVGMVEKVLGFYNKTATNAFEAKMQTIMNPKATPYLYKNGKTRKTTANIDKRSFYLANPDEFKKWQSKITEKVYYGVSFVPENDDMRHLNSDAPKNEAEGVKKCLQDALIWADITKDRYVTERLDSIFVYYAKKKGINMTYFNEFGRVTDTQRYKWANKGLNAVQGDFFLEFKAWLAKTLSGNQKATHKNAMQAVFNAIYAKQVAFMGEKPEKMKKPTPLEPKHSKNLLKQGFSALYDMKKGKKGTLDLSDLANAFEGTISAEDEYNNALRQWEDNEIKRKRYVTMEHVKRCFEAMLKKEKKWLKNAIACFEFAATKSVPTRFEWERNTNTIIALANGECCTWQNECVAMLHDKNCHFIKMNIEKVNQGYTFMRLVPNLDGINTIVCSINPKQSAVSAYGVEVFLTQTKKLIEETFSAVKGKMRLIISVISGTGSNNNEFMDYLKNQNLKIIELSRKVPMVDGIVTDEENQDLYTTQKAYVLWEK